MIKLPFYVKYILPNLIPYHLDFILEIELKIF